MTHALNVTAGDWHLLRRHLLQNEVEQAAIIYADVEASDGGLNFTSYELELLQPSDFDHQSAYHLSLTDECRGRVIKRAWDLGRAMVEVHSHVGMFASVAFSPSDLDGLAVFVPHVRWRLRGTPYAALVMTESGFDGLVWSEESSTGEQLNVVNVEGTILSPTAETPRKMEGHYGR